MVLDILNPSLYFEKCEVKNNIQDIINFNSLNINDNIELPPSTKLVCGKYRNKIDLDMAHLKTSRKIDQDIFFDRESKISIDEDSPNNKLGDVDNFIVVPIHTFVDFECADNLKAGETLNNKLECCLIKIYDDKLNDSIYSLKLNQIIKVYGILSWDNILNLEGKSDEMTFENVTSKLTTNCTVHVIHFEKTYFSKEYSHLSPFTTENIMNIKTNIKNHYELLISMINETLFDSKDIMTSNYLAFLLLVKEPTITQSNRMENLLTRYFCANIMHVDATETPIIASFNDGLINLIKCLSPISSQLNLNSRIYEKPLYPYKIYNDDTINIDNKIDKQLEESKDDQYCSLFQSTLHYSPLQLPHYTFLTINETNLNTENRNVPSTTIGQKNFNVLSQLARNQKLEYDFKYYSLHMDTYFKILLISKGGPSIINPDTYILPLQPFELSEFFKGSGTINSSSQDFIKNRLIEKFDLENFANITHFVRFINTLTAHDDINAKYGLLSEEVKNQIVADFVDIRKNNVKDMSVDDMHRILTLARYHSLCKCQDVSFEDWNYTKKLEKERKERLINCKI
ncbi:unnamed protein product [Gordionus sp. m RMFG-2023]